MGVVEGPFYHNYATTPTQLFLDLQGPPAFQVGLYTSAVLALAAWVSKVQDLIYSKEITSVNFDLPCFSGCLQLGNELQKQSRDQTQAIKPADRSVWSRDRFCKLQAT